MGYNVGSWLSSKFLGTGRKDPSSQKGVSGYMKPKKGVTDALDEAGDISSPTPRRGDTDGEYNTYSEDRNLDEDDED